MDELGDDAPRSKKGADRVKAVIADGHEGATPIAGTLMRDQHEVFEHGVIGPES
jgi:hypothetical protein